MSWTKKQQQAYDRMVVEAKVKYNSAQESWVEFVLYLWKIEDDGVWKHPSYNGFGDFLKQEFPTAWGLARYTNVKRAIQVYGEDFMRRMGIECAHAITVDAMITDAQHVSKMKEACEAHFEEHGVMPGIDDVYKIRSNIVQLPKPVSRLVERRRRERELQQENSQLRQVQAKASRAIEKHEALVGEKDGLKEKLKEVRETRESLLAENKQLKAELRIAKARIRELEKELQRYKRGRSAQPTATA